MGVELEDDWYFNQIRMELNCPHGVGHPVPWTDKSVHGCDGCCDEEKFEEKLYELAEKLKEKHPDALEDYDLKEEIE